MLLAVLLGLWCSAVLLPVSSVLHGSFTVRELWQFVLTWVVVALSCWLVAVAVWRGLRVQWDELNAKVVDLARENGELRDTNLVKSKFIATLSHEIRTPLNSILGFTELLLARSAALGEEDRRALEEVHTAGRHLLALVNDVLDLARMEAGKLALRRDEVSLEAIVQEVLQVLRPQAERKGIEVLSSVPTDVTVHADPSRLRQILINLVGNAVKFTDTGSVTVRGDCEGDRVRVEVVDTGPGIAEVDRGRLFCAFSQLDGSVGRRDGSGLGLAIARELVRAHGGDIGVESETGSGSVFWFTLPAGRGCQTSVVSASGGCDGARSVGSESRSNFGTLDDRRRDV